MTLTGIRPVSDLSTGLGTATAADLPGRPSGQTEAAPDMQQAEVNRAELERAVEQMTRTARIFHTNLEFSTHEETGRILVRVIDNDTGQVVREIPPQKLLDAAASIQQALGLLFDERA